MLGYDLDMQQYIDAHCHIISDEIMNAAAVRGVGRFVVNSTAPADWAAVVNIARRENVFGAIGVHPWYVSEIYDGWDIELIDVLNKDTDLMVGEIGLDKNHGDIDVQEPVFRRQLQIAHDMGRVAHVHCVGAWGKCMEILGGSKLPPAMVLHCFSGAPELVRELTAMGAYFSFGGDVVDIGHKKMRDAVAAVDESRILAESDAVDGTMPDKIPDIVAEIAKIRGKDAGDMAKIIYENTMGILHDKSF